MKNITRQSLLTARPPPPMDDLINSKATVLINNLIWKYADSGVCLLVYSFYILMTTLA